jgi:hypothetical protein
MSGYLHKAGHFLALPERNEEKSELARLYGKYIIPDQGSESEYENFRSQMKQSTNNGWLTVAISCQTI